MDKTDKNILTNKIGLFDSGIGGFSILSELFKILPQAQYFYVSDDANAPYGPKSDEFITNRSLAITEELISKGVSLIVVACNTATAASIVHLRNQFPQISFVGVEPYLNAIYKMPENDFNAQKRMVVLTTESTGKSERFKRLKERLDPFSRIDHFALKNLAKIIENFYHHPIDLISFNKLVEDELSILKGKGYDHAILGCTHYPLIKNLIESTLDLKTISPCSYVAKRVSTFFGDFGVHESFENTFEFMSSVDNIWISKNRSSLLRPFQG